MRLLLGTGEKTEEIIDAVYVNPEDESEWFYGEPEFALRYTMDEISNNPKLAAEIPDEDVRELWFRLTVLQSALMPKMIAAPPAESSKPADSDELLTVEETAILLKVTKRWLFEHSANGDLPFSLYLQGQGRKGLRFDRTGAMEWLKSRPSKR